MKPVLALLILLLSGAAQAQAVQGAPGTISYEEVGPWGNYRLVWWVEASGDGAYQQTGPTQGQKEEGAIRVGPAGFARLHNMLRPLDGTPQMPCPDAITDLGSGVLSWARNGHTTTFILDRGCESENARADAERIDRAIEIVRAWATENRP